jgi:hypothetical protein
VGVLAFVHNSVQMWYYWLPVDGNRQKYVPGELRSFHSVSAVFRACFPHVLTRVSAYAAVFGLLQCVCLLCQCTTLAALLR